MYEKKGKNNIMLNNIILNIFNPIRHMNLEKVKQ